jgi:hypothetical protein
MFCGWLHKEKIEDGEQSAAKGAVHPVEFQGKRQRGRGDEKPMGIAGRVKKFGILIEYFLDIPDSPDVVLRSNSDTNLPTRYQGE